MATTAGPPSTSSSAGAGNRHGRLLDTAIIASGALVVLIMVQAALAGQFLFNGADIALHGHIGNGSFVLGVVIAGLLALARGSVWLTATAGVLLVALFAQTGLGYVGRESLDAASIHIPLGVACLGLAVAVMILAIDARRDRARSAAAA